MHDTRHADYYKAYAVKLDVLVCKCMMARAPGTGVTYFLEYANASGTGRFTLALMRLQEKDVEDEALDDQL